MHHKVNVCPTNGVCPSVVDGFSRTWIISGLFVPLEFVITR